jgi:signal transduction histidine kinase
LSIISLIAWSFCNYFADNATSLSSALFWTRASFPAALGMGLSLTYFSYIFPIKKPQQKYILLFYAFLAIIFSYMAMGDLIIKNITLLESVGVSSVEVGPFYPLLLGVYFLLIIHLTYNFVTSYQRLIGKHKSQVKYVLLGWTTFLSLAVTTNAILPLITGNATWSKFGPLGSIIMVICISYAIIRHEFLDIKIIIQKGLIYSILLSCITSVYLSLVFSFELIFNNSNDVNILVSAFITTLIGIFGVPPLKQYFQKITDTIFFKDGYNYSFVLNELTDALNTNIAFETIVAKTSQILKTSLKVKSIKFSFKEPKKNNSGTATFLTIPIKSNRKKIGELMLGEKSSGDPYTQEDLSLLKTFAQQAGTALEKASLYKQVKDYATTLEEKVATRTQEIFAIQKEQETLMLEISHGLQTPLTIMKGELFFLRKQGYDTERVNTLDTSIDRISTFIYRFLSLSKLETTTENKKSDINLSTTLQGALSFFKQETQEKTIQLSGIIAENLHIEGNKEEIEELLSNLISNSIKYSSQEREKNIEATLTDQGSSVLLTLKDTGIGIKAENLPNLFKKFYRIKEKETKGIQGTGLGLVICKKIVDMHQGTISVASIFGEGTTFIVVLPKKIL